MEELHKLLSEIGFAGIRRGVGIPPETIFDILQELRPENACGSIGKALIDVNRGNFGSAIEQLREAAETCTEATRECYEIGLMVEELRSQIETR